MEGDSQTHLFSNNLDFFSIPIAHLTILPIGKGQFRRDVYPLHCHIFQSLLSGKPLNYSELIIYRNLQKNDLTQFLKYTYPPL